MGRNHARVLSDLPGVRLLGVAEIAASSRESFAAPQGVMTHADVHEMLSRHRPDLVVVAVPTALHASITCAALDAGAHVLVEKPIAASRAEAAYMMTRAREMGRTLMVGHVERFNPAVQELRRAVVAGEMGPIFQMHARRLGAYPARQSDVGVVLDLATHDIDVMHFLTGGTVTRLAAETSHGNPERMLGGLMRFDSGAIGVLDVHWLASHKVRELTVVAEGGTWVVDYLTQDVHWHRPGEPVQRVMVQKREPLRALLEHFVACVLEGREPSASAQAGASALDVALRLLESARRS